MKEVFEIVFCAAAAASAAGFAAIVVLSCAVLARDIIQDLFSKN